MKKFLIILAVIIGIIIIAAASIVGKYNTMVTMRESVKQSWAQVENQYQRRFDLIPNLVNTVKGYAAHEKETLTGVAEARSKAGGVMQIDKSLINDKAAMQKFQQTQATLGSALQRLMVVAERYPDLKANSNFTRLQDELAGTENRIAVERKRYNDTAAGFNKLLVVFPNSMFAEMFNIQQVELFKAPKESQTAPKVEF
ncbi:MAG: LemA family protein [Candidatus Cloacimonadota bacterium]|nr:MAG: LemA family protein [Candidatus Cloacimonadota bacterium]